MSETPVMAAFSGIGRWLGPTVWAKSASAPPIRLGWTWSTRRSLALLPGLITFPFWDAIDLDGSLLQILATYFLSKAQDPLRLKYDFGKFLKLFIL